MKSTNRPPKGDRSEEFDFLAKNQDFRIWANSLNFWLSEIAVGTFLKMPIFRQYFEFSNFRANLPLWRSKSLYFQLIFWMSVYVLGVWTYILGVWTYMLGVWTCILGVWTYTLGVWTHIACFGCLNLYFGHQRTKHSEDLWIWKYWRTKHSGMTFESGNTEGPSILVWPLNLEILKDQAFWYGTKHSEDPPRC